MRLFSLIFAIALLAGSVLALEPGVPVYAGDFMLIASVPSDEPNVTVLTLIHLLASKPGFYPLRYDLDGRTAFRTVATSSPGGPIFPYGTIIVRAPLQSIANTAVSNPEIPTSVYFFREGQLPQFPPPLPPALNPPWLQR